MTPSRPTGAPMRHRRDLGPTAAPPAGKLGPAPAPRGRARSGALAGAVLCALLGAGLAPGCATRQAILGKVIDRNGDPIDRVIVSLDPGDVELITDSDGTFAIDYMRDDKGNRVRLERRRDYSVELFRLGYHVGETTVSYKRGQLTLDPITLTEDTVRMDAPAVELDPGQFRDRTQGTGATYEGE